MTTFVVKYEIEDGYTGGSRPQSFKLDLDDLNSDMTASQIEQFLDEAAQEDMMQKASAVIRNRDDYMQAAEAHIKKMKLESADE